MSIYTLYCISNRNEFKLRRIVILSPLLSEVHFQGKLASNIKIKCNKDNCMDEI